MTTLNITVFNNKVLIDNPVVIPEGNYNTIFAVFDLPDEWNGLTAKVKFGNIAPITIPANKTVAVPLFNIKGDISVKVFAYALENDEYSLIHSPAPSQITICEGSFDDDGDTPVPPTPETEYLDKTILWNGYSAYFESLETVPTNAQRLYDSINSNIGSLTLGQVITAIENINTLLPPEAEIDGAKITKRTIYGAANGENLASKILPGSIGKDDIADSAITRNKIANEAINNTKIAVDAVRKNHILAGSITNSKIYDGAVTADKIADGTITSFKLEPALNEQLSINPLFLGVDKQINFIAYSHTANSGCTINTAEEYIYNCTHGYTSVKGDMRLTSDGKIIMCHDAGFTFNSSGRITAYDDNNKELIHNNTYAYWMSKQYVDGSYVCDLETFVKICKTYGKTAYTTLRYEYVDETIAEMFRVLDKYGMRDNSIINCTNYTPLYTLRRIDKVIPISYYVGDIDYYDETYPKDDYGRVTRIKFRINQAKSMGNCILVGGLGSLGVSALDTVVTDDDGVSPINIIDYAAKTGVRFYCFQITTAQDAISAFDKGATGYMMTCDVPIDTGTTGSVTDVTVNGTSVVNNGVAAVTVPTNYVTTNTTQDINGVKTIKTTTGNSSTVLNDSDGTLLVYLSQNPQTGNETGIVAQVDVDNPEDGYIDYYDKNGSCQYKIPKFSDGGAHTFAMTEDIPSLSNYVTKNTNETITGEKTFEKSIAVVPVSGDTVGIEIKQQYRETAFPYKVEFAPYQQDYKYYVPRLTVWYQIDDNGTIKNDFNTLVLPDYVDRLTIPEQEQALLTDLSPINPANVLQNSSYRFVTDSEKSTWNGKANTSDIPTNNNQLTNGAGYQTASDVSTAIAGNQFIVTFSQDSNNQWICDKTFAEIESALLANKEITVKADYSMQGMEISFYFDTIYYSHSGGMVSFGSSAITSSVIELQKFTVNSSNIVTFEEGGFGKTNQIYTSQPRNEYVPSEAAVVNYVNDIVGNINSVLDTINGEVI